MLFAGENPESVYYIEKGKVSVYDISAKGEEVVINLFGESAFIPMSWALNKTPNAFFYRAEEETIVRIADPDGTVAFIKDHPDIMLDLLARVYRGFEGIAGRMVHLMSDSARARLAYELVIESHRFGHHEKTHRYRLDINESDLAARTGLTRETISREIHNLKEEKLVAIDRHGITILDLLELERTVSSL